MGLDAWLYARKHVHSFNDPQLQTKLNQIIEVLDFPGEANGISVEVLYWRKANAIHGWFVENVQDGEDDCREVCVRRENLVKLKETIDRCLENPLLANELLPTRSGCFFGSLEYDEYYWDDLKRTTQKLEQLLLRVEDGDWEWSFYYSSSW